MALSKKAQAHIAYTACSVIVFQLVYPCDNSHLLLHYICKNKQKPFVFVFLLILSDQFHLFAVIVTKTALFYHCALPSHYKILQVLSITVIYFTLKV